MFLRLVGSTQDWLNDIFKGELYMNVSQRKFKNRNELTCLKGVLFKYSESVIYVKRELNL